MFILTICTLIEAATVEDLAKVAREVGKEQGMLDVDSPIPEKLLPIKQPKTGEGFFPVNSVSQDNPYRKNLNIWCANLLTKKPVIYGPSTKEKKIMDRLGGSNPDYGTRTEMTIAKNLYFLVTDQASPYFMNEEVFRRYLRRVMCYANEYNLHSNGYKDYLNDFFALGPALYVMRMTVDTYGELLLPSQKKAIDDCMQKALTFWLGETEKITKDTRYSFGYYANRDLGFANILLNAGLYLNNKPALDYAKKLVEAQKNNQYPDGAFAYIGTQNESATYHGTDISFLSRYYVVTRDETAKNLLKNSKNCPLLENEPSGLADFWTAPSWKHTWNGGNYWTMESVAYFNNDPYLRKFLDNQLQKNGLKDIDAINIPFYKKLAAKDLPNNYTVIDRNIDGVRARYNDYSMAATLRKITTATEPGLPTLVGAMTKETVNNKEQIDSILMFARPKILTVNPKNKKAEWAMLTDSLKSDILLGKNYSVFGATHKLHTFGSSTKGRVTDFIGNQLYLSVQDHLIGVMQVQAASPQLAQALATEFRLGYGGFAVKQPKELQKISDKQYRYGNLIVNILDTNFPEFEIQQNKVRNDNNGALAHDFVFSTPVSNENKEFTPDEQYYLVYEIYPVSSTQKVTIEKINCKNQLSFEAKTDKCFYEISYNSKSNKINLKTNDNEKAWKNFDELLNK